MTTPTRDSFDYSLKRLIETITNTLISVNYPFKSNLYPATGYEKYMAEVAEIMFTQRKSTMFVHQKPMQCSVVEVDLMFFIDQDHWRDIFNSLQEIEFSASSRSSVSTMKKVFENCARLLCGKCESRQFISDILVKAEKIHRKLPLPAKETLDLVRSKFCVTLDDFTEKEMTGPVIIIPRQKAKIESQDMLVA